jgi:hypothetical protein
MEQSTKMALFEALLEEVAEQAGDITPEVLSVFYQAHPEAVGLFAEKRLEEMMVSQALHCVLVWLSRPMEIKILLRETIAHHNEVFAVSALWFTGLFESLMATLEAHSGRCGEEARMLLHELRDELLAEVAQASSLG